jgi:hypothetical protein
MQKRTRLAAKRPPLPRRDVLACHRRPSERSTGLWLIPNLLCVNLTKNLCSAIWLSCSHVVTLPYCCWSMLIIRWIVGGKRTSIPSYFVARPPTRTSTTSVPTQLIETLPQNSQVRRAVPHHKTGIARHFHCRRVLNPATLSQHRQPERVRALLGLGEPTRQHQVSLDKKFRATDEDFITDNLQY